MKERSNGVNYIGENTRHHLSVQILVSEKNIPPKQGGAKEIKGTIKQSMKNVVFSLFFQPLCQHCTEWSPGTGATLSHRAGTARAELPAQPQPCPSCQVPSLLWHKLASYNWAFNSSLKLKVVDILEVTAR